MDDRLSIRSFGSLDISSMAIYLYHHLHLRVEIVHYRRAKDKIELYREYNIRYLHIVTVSTHYNFKISGIEFFALPFYEWALME